MKKWIIVAIAILAILVFGVILFTGNNNDIDQPMELNTDVGNTVVEMESTTVEITEVQTTEVADNIEEVSLTNDFRFDVQRSSQYSYASDIENGEEEQNEVLLEAYTHKDVESTGGWIRLSSEHVYSTDSNNYIEFYGNHSNFSVVVEEEEPSLTSLDLRSVVANYTTFPEYFDNIHEIPFGTSYILNEEFKDEEKYFPEVKENPMASKKHFIKDSYQVLFEDSIDTRIGILYVVGYYNQNDKLYHVVGYMKTDEGRSFTINGSDDKYDYLIAYLSDIFDNCIALR